MRSRAILSACLLIALLAVTNIAQAGRPNKQVPDKQVGTGTKVASRLVKSALEAELAGNIEKRSALLQQAITADPTYAPAHWQLGEFLVGEKWLSADEATRQSNQQERYFEYANRRTATGKSAAEQLELARWCRQEGLVEQHRTHALLAMAADPNLIEAKSELSLCQFNGIWLTPKEMEQRKLRHEETKKAFDRWKPEVTRLMRLAKKSTTARGKLQAISDPTAIPAIEGLLSVESEQTAIWAVAALSNMREQVATESLVRHAVLSKWEQVRQKAAESLSSRSIYSYAPLLLAGLEAPIEVEFNFTEAEMDGGIGSWRYRCSLFREGPAANSALDVQSTVVVGGITIEDRRPPGGPGRSVTVRPPHPESHIDQLLPEKAAAAVDALNAQTRALNSRIGRALYLATSGNPTSRSAKLATNSPSSTAVALPNEVNSTEPREWWKWWYDYNEIYYPSERPTQQYSSYDTRSAGYRIVIASCFIAGTPVWTPLGALAIDRVQAGDLVLAQHPETGELAFKAVLGTTVRPPSPMVRIVLGQNDLIATRGHPLWVVGKGWRMAKELRAGDLLHTATGPLEITAIEAGPKEAAYNLVVDEFNTYCVGPDRVLAHDNNLRQPTDVVVPGLAAQP